MKKTVEIKVITGAKREKISRMADGRLKVKVKQAAEKGKANQRVKEILAGQYKTSPENITIIKGIKNNYKTVKIVK